jgi:DNA-binding CsgD family transcriptional regulator
VNRGAGIPGARLLPRSAWQRYGTACLAVALAWTLRASLLTQPFDRSPFLAFGLAVLLAATIGGFGPGLLATGLSSIVAVFFYLPPELALAVHDPVDVLQLGLFALEGVCAAAIGDRARRWVIVGGRLPESRLDALVERAESIRGRRAELAEPLVERLTARELEVAALLALGYSNEQIAASLFLSTNTVKTHLKHLYGKLGVRTRTEATARCIELRLLSRPPETP